MVIFSVLLVIAVIVLLAIFFLLCTIFTMAIGYGIGCAHLATATIPDAHP